MITKLEIYCTNNNRRYLSDRVDKYKVLQKRKLFLHTDYFKYGYFQINTMIAFNRDYLDSSGIVYDESDLMDSLDSMILDSFNSMSVKEFVEYISNPLASEEKAKAYKYLFELLDDNNRIDAILDYAERKGIMGNREDYE